MLAESNRALQTSPHVVLFPGLAIVLSVLGFNLLGDGLREALDPRLDDPRRFRRKGNRRKGTGGRGWQTVRINGR
jgi:hypothetical protein